MNHQDSALTIGRLAATVGVNVETIRFYQRKGKLREPVRPPLPNWRPAIWPTCGHSYRISP